MSEEDLATDNVPEVYRTAESQAGEAGTPDDLLPQADVAFGESVDRIADTAEQRGLTPDEVVSDIMLAKSRSTEMRDPIEMANLFTFGLSYHGQHLNGADLTWDGGMTLPY